MEGDGSLLAITALAAARQFSTGLLVVLVINVNVSHIPQQPLTTHALGLYILPVSLGKVFYTQLSNGLFPFSS